MHVLSPAPYITRIATTFPVEVGTPLRVIGGNFYEIQRIYFTTAEGDITDAPVSTEITEFKVNAARKSKVDDNTARMQSIKQLGV